MTAQGITGPPIPASDVAGLQDEIDDAVDAHVALTDPHTKYARILLDTAGTYAVATGAEIYVGDTDPGAVADGSLWIPAS